MSSRTFYILFFLVVGGISCVMLSLHQHIIELRVSGQEYKVYYNNALVNRAERKNVRPSTIRISLEHERILSLIPNIFQKTLVQVKELDNSIEEDQSLVADYTQHMASEVLSDTDKRYITASRLSDVGRITTYSTQKRYTEYSVYINTMNPSNVVIETDEMTALLRSLWHYENILTVDGTATNGETLPIQFLILIKTIVGKIGLNMIFASLVYIVIYITTLLFTILKKHHALPYMSFLKSKSHFISRNILGILLTVVFIFYCMTLFLSSHVMQQVPHSQDEVSYLFQAKTYAAGMLAAHPVADAIKPFFSHEFILNGKTWSGIFPPGWPMVLSIGILMGSPSFIPVVIGILNLVSTFLITRKLLSEKVALVQTLFLSISPFFILQSASFFSHGLALLLQNLLVYCVLKKKYLLAGFFWGFLLLTRPFNAVTVGIPILYIIFFLEKTAFKKILLNFVYLLPGLLVNVAFLFLYNKIVTNNIFVMPQSFYFPGNTIGFGPRGSEWNFDFTPIMGFQNVILNIHSFLDTVNGLPYWISIYAVFYLFFARPNKIVGFLMVSIVTQIFGYFLYHYHGIIFGPRYWFEVFPYFILLFILGLQTMYRMMYEEISPSLSRLPIFSIIGVLVFWSWISTLSILAQVKEENGMFRENLPVNPPHKALILVPSANSWQDYGRFFILQSPKLNERYIYARDQGLDNAGKNTTPLDNKILKKYFPDRDLYLLDREGKRLLKL